MYTIEVKLEDLHESLARLTAFAEDSSAVMRGIGGVLMAAVERGFETESDPVSGQKWAPLTKTTQNRRASTGHTGKILQVSGGLAASFSMQTGPHSVRLGTNLLYAATMHFGAKKGAFGSMSIVRTRQVVPIPWGDIPRRPILPIDEKGAIHAEDEDEILDLLKKNVTRLFLD